jgi:hypothetical protein
MESQEFENDPRWAEAAHATTIDMDRPGEQETYT